eukprot:3248108-Rhodomonas_salina.2
MMSVQRVVLPRIRRQRHWCCASVQRHIAKARSERAYAYMRRDAATFKSDHHHEDHDDAPSHVGSRPFQPV